jgi:hypothetical protein
VRGASSGDRATRPLRGLTFYNPLKANFLELRQCEVQLLRIPCEVPGAPPPLEGVAKALRSHSRRSQRVFEVYSPSILNLVRGLVSLPSYPRGVITVSSWLVVQGDIL